MPSFDVVSEVDPQDARRRIYRLNLEHKQTFDAVFEAMENFEAVYEALWKEIGVDLSEAITKAETAPRQQPLNSRYAAMYSLQAVSSE